MIQHNGCGTVNVVNFYAEDYGKVYRSCGNCKGNGAKRNVTIKNVKASGGKVLAGINSNYGDVATISNTCATSVKKLCVEFKGTNNNNEEPKEIKSGISNYCKYSSIPSC